MTRCAIPSTRSDWQTSRRRHARPSARCGAPPRNIYRNARPQSGEGVGQKTRRSFRNRASKTETHIARNCICVRWCVRIFFAFSHCGTATHFAYLRDGRISKIGKSDFRLTTCRSTLRKREDDQASCFARTNSLLPHCQDDSILLRRGISGASASKPAQPATVASARIISSPIKHKRSCRVRRCIVSIDSK